MPRKRKANLVTCKVVRKRKKIKRETGKTPFLPLVQDHLVLHSDILLLLCEYLTPQSLFSLSKTCKSLRWLRGSELVWKRKCKVDFGLVTCGNLDYITLYEHYYKLRAIGRAVFQFDEMRSFSKGELSHVHYCWFSIFRNPPDVWFINPSRVTKTAAQKAFVLKGEEELKKVSATEQHYDEGRGITYYTWKGLYDVALSKFQSLVDYQKHVIWRFTPFRREYLQKHYEIYLGQQKRNKLFSWLNQEDNRTVALALGRNFPYAGTYAIMEGHEIFKTYQNRKLVGDLDAIREYAHFCDEFADWVEEKSAEAALKENSCKDYRESIDFAVKKLTHESVVRMLPRSRYLRKAKIYYNRIVRVWMWYKRHGPQEFSGNALKYERLYWMFLETGRKEHLLKLKNKIEGTITLRQLLLDNKWMMSVLPKENLRPLQCSNSLFSLMINGEPRNDPEVSRLVQKFLSSGSNEDLHDIFSLLSNQVENFLNLHTQNNAKLKKCIKKGNLLPRSRTPSRL